MASDSVSAPDGVQIELMQGISYDRNLSISRVIHQRQIAAEFLRRAGRKPQPALIFAAYPSPELCDAGSRYAASHGVPLALDIRDAWPDIIYRYLPAILRPAARIYFCRYRTMLARAVQGSTAVYASSERNLRWAFAAAGMMPRPGDEVVYHAYQPLRLAPAPHAGMLTCLFVGSLGHSYDLGVVIEAGKILAQRGETGIQLRIIGDGELKPRWDRSAEGVPNVVLTGWLGNEALRTELSQADVGLLTVHGATSDFTVPNKLGEYLAAALYIVNTTPGETSEIVARELVGSNVKPSDPAALADLLQRLHGNRELLAAGRAASRSAFERRFSADTVYARFAERLIGMARSSDSV